MTLPASASVPTWRLEALRAELADLAYELERQRRCDAADIANMLAARVAEIAMEPGAARASEEILSS